MRSVSVLIGSTQQLTYPPAEDIDLVCTTRNVHAINKMTYCLRISHSRYWLVYSFQDNWWAYCNFYSIWIIGVLIRSSPKSSIGLGMMLICLCKKDKNIVISQQGVWASFDQPNP